MSGGSEYVDNTRSRMQSKIDELETELAELKRQVKEGELMTLEVAGEYAMKMWRYAHGKIAEPIGLRQYAASRQKEGAE